MTSRLFSMPTVLVREAVYELVCVTVWLRWKVLVWVQSSLCCVEEKARTGWGSLLTWL